MEQGGRHVLRAEFRINTGECGREHPHSPEILPGGHCDRGHGGLKYFLKGMAGSRMKPTQLSKSEECNQISNRKVI